MPAAPRRPYGLLVTAVVLLALGALVAQQVGAALGLRYTPVTPPVEHLAAAPVVAAVAPPAISAIAVPDDPRLRLAAGAVADAYAARGAARPAVTTGTAGSDALRVTVGQGTSEAYTLAGRSLTADSTAGAAAGLYQVADRVRAGAAMPVGRQSPALGLRLADAGAVGLDDDPARFASGDDYSLNTDVVGSALLPAAPWVDATAVGKISDQFRAYVDHALAGGYNGVVLPGFLEYVTFGDLGVYPAGDPHVARAKAMVAAFGPVWKYAHDMGMKVYLQTDMLAVSPPLKKFLAGKSTEDPALWKVYQAGLAELFTSMPYVDGLMIRTGEGGGDYKLAGWDYSSEITVTTVAAVRAMLRAFLAVASPAGKDVIFRTWSVGVGAVGDLHTNPTSYATVFDGLDDPHLIVSTKYSLGDFYSHLPVNDTLFAGAQKRIVEFQSRREFEGLGALPDDLGDLEQQALRTILAHNPNVIGVWDWTQNGGPLYAGGRTLYLRDGFWQLYDLNVYLTARLAWDPATDVAAATNDWIRSTFSDDPATVAAVARAFALSRDAITEGLYIGPYADHKVSALGLEPPPMMWIFEWDIVTGDSAALDSVYAVSRDRLDEAIAGGASAVAAATRMRALVAGTDPASWRDPATRSRFLDSLDYEVDLLGTLSAYREMVLRHTEWLDTGSAAAKSAWQAAEARYGTARAAHVARYSGDIALPAYNFTAADLGVARADRDALMAWLARLLLVLVAAAFALGAFGRGPVALRALWLGATRPWRVRDLPAPDGRLDRVLVWLVPALALAASRSVLTWFAAPAHLVLTLGAWVVFALVLRALIGRRDPWRLWALVGGAALLRTVVLLLALVRRGPGRYWFDFWTAPGVRAFYITVAFAAFAWVLVVAFVALRSGYGLRRRRSLARVLVGAGAPVVVLGALIAAIGTERALTVWNDQMALLPWGLSRILGITVYLGIPTSLPLYAATFGAVLALAGGALTLGRRVPTGPDRRTHDGRDGVTGGAVATTADARSAL